MLAGGLLQGGGLEAIQGRASRLPGGELREHHGGGEGVDRRGGDQRQRQEGDRLLPAGRQAHLRARLQSWQLYQQRDGQADAALERRLPRAREVLRGSHRGVETPAPRGRCHGSPGVQGSRLGPGRRERQHGGHAAPCPSASRAGVYRGHGGGHPARVAQVLSWHEVPSRSSRRE